MGRVGTLVVLIVIVAAAVSALVWKQTHRGEAPAAQVAQTGPEAVAQQPAPGDGGAAPARPAAKGTAPPSADSTTHAQATKQAPRPQTWEEVSALAPDSPAHATALIDAAASYERAGEADKAARLYRKVAASPPSDAFEVKALARLAVMDPDEKQREEFKWRLLNKYASRPEAAELAEKVGRENIQAAFSPDPSFGSTYYTVVAGDNLTKIAKKYNTTPQLIMRCNRMDSDKIRPGQRLKVIDGTFSITVDVPRCVLVLFLNDRFFKRYAVGVGRNDSTPAGTFEICAKLVNPTWFAPDGHVYEYGDEGNLLGTRWMSLDVDGYGIHGTWEPETVGKASSAGCIRMTNEDVEELFDIVPLGTKVTIVKDGG